MEIDDDVPVHTYKRRALQYAFARLKTSDVAVFPLIGAHAGWLWLVDPITQRPFSDTADAYELLTSADLADKDTNARLLARELKQAKG